MRKVPRTRRGRETLVTIMEAALQEFGEKGFHEGSISEISRRANLAPGGIYNYFDSKDEIFRALVTDINVQFRDQIAAQVRTAADEMTAEKRVLETGINFVRQHKGIYRIVTEAEFIYPEGHRALYEALVERVGNRLRDGALSGEIRPDVGEIHAWAIIGINVMLALRYGVWAADEAPDRVSAVVNDMLKHGLNSRTT
ncbi:hypothetical protein ATM17_30695 (plasmid) [Sphingopyxis macrogoltabida]|uniref:HTH tetR-type domain-containing protein n=2 Tax=Sphingopyxis macrogoltabida TaxID=33050 RepID=A0AAC9AZA0_SPHMC|nr:hypothetical protein ATM17_30695 [Sphingopyxis macrogoltabida]